MCLTEPQLIRLIGGEVTAQQRAECFEHLEACPVCRDAYARLQATWDALGTWQVTPPPKDLAASILATAGQERAHPVWRGRLAVAAAIVVSASAGVIAALAIPQRSPAVARDQITIDQVAEAIGLDSVGAESAVFAPLFDQTSNQEPS